MERKDPSSPIINFDTFDISKYKNQDFYLADGSFSSKNAKEVYFAMMESFNYPIADRLRGDEFWISDFNLNQFMTAGMAGIFWIINMDHKFTGVEMFLLPGQSIPEHWHVATENASAKFESGHVRYGSITLFTEGSPLPDVEDRIPYFQRDIVKARKEQVLNAGDVGFTEKKEERHWFIAGQEGAIITEYASAHDGEGVRFTDPTIKF